MRGERERETPTSPFLHSSLHLTVTSFYRVTQLLSQAYQSLSRILQETFYLTVLWSSIKSYVVNGSEVKGDVGKEGSEMRGTEARVRDRREPEELAGMEVIFLILFLLPMNSGSFLVSLSVE